MPISLSFIAGAIVLAGGIFLLSVFLINRFPALVFAVFLVYTLCSIMVSILYIEIFPTFLNEPSLISKHVGAWWRFALHSGLVLTGAALGGQLVAAFSGLRFDARDLRFPYASHQWIALAIIAVVLFLQYTNIILAPQTAFLNPNITRHNFWTASAPFPVFAQVFGIVMMFCPFVIGSVMMFTSISAARMSVSPHFSSSSRFFAAAMLMLGYIGYLLLTGQVFHGILWPVSVAAGFYLLRRRLLGKAPISLAQLPAALFVVIVLATFVVSAFANRGISAEAGSSVGGVMYRILALQGSTYWANVHFGLLSPQGSFRDLLQGRDFLLNSLLPPALYESYALYGVNLQGAFPGTAFMIYGDVGGILAASGFGVAFGVVCGLVLYFVWRGPLFLLFPVAYIWTWVMTIFSRGSLEEVVLPKFLAFCLIVGAYQMIRQPMRRRVSSVPGKIYEKSGYDPA